MVNSNYDISHYNIVSVNGITNILVALTMFSIFLAIFYFTYASKIEKDILDIQLKNLVDNLTSDLTSANIDSSQIKKIINNTKIDLTKEDNEVADENKKIINKAIISFGLFAAVTVTIVSILFYMHDINIRDIIITNLILLFFVAITEIFFLNMIAKSYRSLDPNIVKKNLLDKLLSFESSKV